MHERYRRSTEVVDGSVERIEVKPVFSFPEEGVQIRTNDLAAIQEERLHKVKSQP